MKQHALILEDDLDTCKVLEDLLVTNNFKVTTHETANETLNYIQELSSKNKSVPDLYLLDWRLAGSLSGLDVCKFLRAFNSTKDTSILMVTAVTEPKYIVEGLDAGADDYITKPFEHQVLMARIQSLTKRRQLIQNINHQDKSLSVLEVGSVRVDQAQFQTWVDERPLSLTPSEFKLLTIFLKNPGKVLTRSQLVENIQGSDVHVSSRVIDTHLVSLRKKLSPENSNLLIETVRGVGYRCNILYK